MKVGVTGTRHGMTPPQTRAVGELLVELSPTEFHHGACVGADHEAALVASVLSSIKVKVIAHPGVSSRGGNNELLSKEALSLSDEVCETKTHFARNRDIVNETDVLIAMPSYPDPITPDTHGGTAYTVNYARKVGKPVYIVRPDGSVERP